MYENGHGMVVDPVVGLWRGGTATSFSRWTVLVGVMAATSTSWTGDRIARYKSALDEEAVYCVLVLDEVAVYCHGEPVLDEETVYH
jgi:hypothetical protein